MPDPIPPASQADLNAEIARKQAEQDINGKPTNPSVNTPSGSALDALAAEVTKKHEETPPQPTAEEKAAADAKAAEEKAAADKKAADDKEAADKKAADDAAAAGTTAPVVPPVVEEDPAKKVAEIFKDSPGLPPGASPKSSEAFSAVKVKAAQEITARDKKILELEAALKQRDEKLKNPVPPEMHKELEELRSFRAKLDVEADPQFKAFDKTIASSQEFIYAQLLKSPSVTPELIAQIKKLGGPEMVDMAPVFAGVKDQTIQRIVEAKIADIEQAKWQKEEAIKTTKAHVSDYVKKREEHFQKSATAHTEATRERLNALSEKALPWLAVKTADAKATDAIKKSVEDHNSFVKQTKEQLEAALTDDSPEMRAILMIATAQYLNLTRVHAATVAESAALKKQVEDLNTKLEKFKQGSVSRLRESGAQPGNIPPAAVKKVEALISVPATQALDDLARTITEERERAKVGA
jgi:hypothetical protein